MSHAFAQSTLQAAGLRIEQAVGAVAERLAETLASTAPPFGSSRQTVALLQGDLHRQLAAFKQRFGAALHERIAAEAGQPERRQVRPSAATWETLSLVENDVMDQRVNTDRVAMQLADGSDWELRELDSFIGALLYSGQLPPGRNPLRTEVVAQALLTAVDSVTDDADGRQLLLREFGRLMSPELKSCYAAIVAQMRSQGVRAAGMMLKPSVATPAYAGTAPSFFSETTMPASFESSGRGGMDRGGHAAAVGAQSASPAGHAASSAPGGLPAGLRDTFVSSGAGSMRGADHGGAVPGHYAGGSSSAGMPLRSPFASSGAGGMPGARPGSMPSQPYARGAGSAGLSLPGGDAQMLDMLRRLALSSAIMPSDFQRPATSVETNSFAGSTPGSGFGTTTHVNLIRQHREELVHASSGALDHMVIDVVSAMFDHLLSDSKVPPQLARQIARLQMPVLRAALKDMGFFSSRRHPVRRFVNRIASLAVAYEDLDQGPGRDFIERVRALVQEIVEGDFDQMDIYESKLHQIETLIHEQSRRDVGSHAKAAVLLDGRETQLRIQQRYMLQLRGHLDQLELPAYLCDFLSQVWSQVQVQVAGPTGSPTMVQRMQRAAQELIWSVQPKGEPQLRKGFLLKLPQLMKDLNDGMALIRWPETAKKEFFAQLLPAHANSLKTPPLTDFQRRQLKHKIEVMSKVAIPTEQDLTPSGATPLPPPEQHAAPLQFSPEEVKNTGFVEESAVDWDGVVDINLAESQATTTTGPVSTTAATTLSGNTDFEPEPEPDKLDGAPPTHGPDLIHHLQTGIAYRMHLKGRWQRVRLSWVSPGRAFFVFTHGKAHEQTVSMTARMLKRMCETERFRTFEQAELLERATSRARKQLAQLTAASGLAALATTRH